MCFPKICALRGRIQNPFELVRWSFFAKITIFAKSYIFDARMDSEYASDLSKLIPKLHPSCSLKERTRAILRMDFRFQPDPPSHFHTAMTDTASNRET